MSRRLAHSRIDVTEAIGAPQTIPGRRARLARAKPPEGV